MARWILMRFLMDLRLIRMINEFKQAKQISMKFLTDERLKHIVEERILNFCMEYLIFMISFFINSRFLDIKTL